MINLNLEKMDSILSSKYRLAILALLAGGDEIEFKAFKEQLDISDGNLSSHMSKLEKNECVSIRKRISNKKTLTTYTITEKGKDIYLSYLEEISKLYKENSK